MLIMKPLLKNHNPNNIDLSNNKPDLYNYKLKSRALQAIALNILLRLL